MGWLALRAVAGKSVGFHHPCGRKSRHPNELPEFRVD